MRLDIDTTEKNDELLAMVRTLVNSVSALVLRVENVERKFIDHLSKSTVDGKIDNNMILL